MRRIRPKLSANGFSLIEAVVALAILGLSLSVALGTLSQGLEIAGKTRARADMLIIAENLLATITSRRELSQIQQEGYGPGPYLWRLTVEPRFDEVHADGRIVPLPDTAEHVLFRIRAEVRPSDGRTAAPLFLETAKTAWFREE